MNEDVKEGNGLRAKVNPQPFKNLQRFPEFEQCLLHIFRDQFCFCQDRHEIRVAIPAGDDVEVDVLVNTGASSSANVRTDIKAIGLHDFLEGKGHFF